MIAERFESIEESLSHELGLDERELNRRKEWLEFDQKDVENLSNLLDLAQRNADVIIEDLYEHFLSFEETAAFFRDPSVLDHVKSMQRAYFLRLAEGDYEMDYLEERLRVGAVHERIGLDVKWYLGAYARYMRSIGRLIMDSMPDDPKSAFSVFFSLKKLVFLDIGLALDTYFFRREQMIRKQEEAIRELSTPVLQVRDRLLILPIIGIIDSQRARQVTENLLTAIRVNRAKVVVIDITGVADVDSSVANHLVQTVEASRLMGAEAVVTGLSADVAQTLVTLGVDLSKLNTVGDLQGGIEVAERILGYRVIREAEG